MKKFWAGILILVLLLIPIKSYAMLAPLEAQGKSVYLSDNNEVALISYIAFLRVRTGFTSINTSLVVKNLSDQESIKALMGIPAALDSATTIQDLTVAIGSKSVKYYERKTLQGEDNGTPTNINKWYVWEISLEPGEIQVIECAFSIDNKTDLDGTKTIDFPLRLLEGWAGKIENVKIIADLDFYPPYVFEPNPSIIPLEYDRDGRLTWSFRDVDSFSTNLSIYFRPIENIVVDYINNKLPSNDEVKTVLELYKSKNYYNAIQQLNQLLTADPDSEINSVSSELKFLRALCYQELYQLDKALEEFDQIEDNLGFGETLSNTIRNKILYDRAMMLKSIGKDNEEVLAYLNEIKDSIKNNEVFLLWLNDEVKRLTPAPPEPEPEEQDAASEEQEEVSAEEKNVKVINSIDILGYEIPIEIALGAIVLIIIIILIIRSNRRKRRTRYSLFR